MAEEITLEQLRAKHPTMASFVEGGGPMRVAYDGWGGVYAAYELKMAANLLPIPYFSLCTFKDGRPEIVHPAEGVGPDWMEDVVDDAAYWLATGWIAPHDVDGELVVDEDDMDRVLDAQTKDGERFARLEVSLKRFARLRELRAADDLVAREAAIARARWRTVAPRARGRAWMPAVVDLADELKMVVDDGDPGIWEKIRRVKEALVDIGLLEGSHPKWVEVVEQYVRDAWRDIADADEAKVYPWPGSLANRARALGIVVMVVAPG